MTRSKQLFREKLQRLVLRSLATGLLGVLVYALIIGLYSRHVDAANYDLIYPIPLPTPIPSPILTAPQVPTGEAQGESSPAVVESVGGVYDMSTPTPTRAATDQPLPIEIVEEIERVFGDDAENALKVAQCESGFRTVICNDGLNRDGTVDCGIFQINSNVHGIDRKWLKNYRINIAAAKQLHDEWGNWSPWYSSYKCHGLK